MARFALIFWYTGFNQPYQLVTFGNRFFTDSTFGILVAAFYAAEVVGAFVSAKIVDVENIEDRVKAVRGYSLFFVVTTVGYVVAAMMEWPRIDDPDHVPDKNGVSNLVMGTVVMMFWGFSDSQIQALSYWQIGGLFN